MTIIFYLFSNECKIHGHNEPLSLPLMLMSMTTVMSNPPPCLSDPLDKYILQFVKLSVVVNFKTNSEFCEGELLFLLVDWLQINMQCCLVLLVIKFLDFVIKSLK